jgi:predicted ribosome quality control (RQC) complex YloA/Tae2 family protein
MFFDALTMACIADELRNTILHGRVQRVVLPDKLSVALEIYAEHQRHYLLASAHAEMGCLLLTLEKPRRGVDKGTGLLLLLRKYARGAIISAIDQPPFERILRLEFDHPDWGCSELYVEIMGRHSNIILVDVTGQVLDAMKRIGPQLSAKRPVLPGRPYTPPPPQAKLLPSSLTEYRLQQILATVDPDNQVWQALVRGLRGMSPLLAREIVFRALGHPRAKVSQVKRLTPLLEETRRLLAPLDDGQWQPTLGLDEGRPVVYAPYRISHLGEIQPMASVSAAIERYNAAIASGDPYFAAKRPLQQAIVAARTRLERRREALRRTTSAAAEAEKWREWGEWILAYAHTISPGQVELAAETGDGGVLVIPLEPDKRPTENAQAYFARYRKAQRAAEDGPARIEEVTLALYDLEQLETDLAIADSRPQVDEVRAAMMDGGYLPTKTGRAPKPTRSEPLCLTSPDGFTILLGRNSRQNDEVTFRRASRDDWWFHVRGVPGAHVIARVQGETLSPDTIRRAAELAAYFSGLRDEAKVAVDYTQRRYVRRIPGAAPGLVTYTQEQTIRIAPRGPEA